MNGSAPLDYCPDLLRYARRLTREVRVGAIGIGGKHPIRIQSMITSDTRDTAACVAEVLGLADLGCEIVRITAQTKVYAANLAHIARAVRAAGCQVPLVADIHFKPDAALEAAKWVEKVRINPGNYADKKKFEIREYSDAQYDEELERIREDFSPLVLLCRDLGRAMRIGTNHGSLSDRIMNRYGDSPLGMVESALEFARIAREHDYHALVFSMKASNPKVMIEAYRLLVARLVAEGPDWNYPIHLGVTEAGDGEDARIKSAIGIGSLLADGIGDTVRVSLTEDSVHEIPVARALIEQLEVLENPRHGRATAEWTGSKYGKSWEEVLGARRSEHGLAQDAPATFITTTFIPPHDLAQDAPATSEASSFSPSYDPFSYERRRSSALTIMGHSLGGENTVRVFTTQNHWNSLAQQVSTMGDFKPEIIVEKSGVLAIDPGDDAAVASINTRPAPCLVTVADGTNMAVIPAFRLLASRIDRRHPILLKDMLEDFPASKIPLDALLSAARNIGSLLCDGIGDAVLVRSEADASQSLRLAYNILQAAGNRIFKTDYVACPSCGRTLFNLQHATQKIRAATGHLKGVRIAIMGCIVNGPGEMADADFGYVGGAPGKINLYVGKSAVRFNIPEGEAVDHLIDLIREHGKWVDSPLASSPEVLMP
ncbi:MAG: (E)-4-hydroxy-3-methylbut-2-enyl-diphosphate synthase [Verrucomicrobiota bacterium]